MSSRGLILRRVLWLSAVAVARHPKFALAQIGGVAIEAAGVVQLKSTAADSERLTKEQQAALIAGLNTKAAKRSGTRYISLKHLEQSIHEHNGAITDEMRYLAGLLRVQYVFFYPDSGDIVIAGPAEGWTTDPCGARCRHFHRSPLHPPRRPLRCSSRIFAQRQSDARHRLLD